MPARKMRVEVFDGEGNRYTVSFEGQITREKAVRLLDLVELLGGVSTQPSNVKTDTIANNSGSSKYDKVKLVVCKHFPIAWFSSRDIRLTYEQEYKEPVSLSTVATYLARMADRSVVLKTGASNSLKYRLAPVAEGVVPRQHLPE